MSEVQRHLSAAWTALTVVCVTVAAFGLRFLPLRGLPNDHYMQLALAQQIVFGEIPGRDFIDPGLPLSMGLSAAVQSAWPVPLSEAMLTIGFVAIAAGATSLVVQRVTGSRLAALAGGIVVASMEPALYGYYKMLAPALLLALLAHYAARPSRARLLAVAVWTVLSLLFRYDIGVYMAAAGLAGLVAVHWGNRRDVGRVAFEYAALAAVVLLPYLAFVQWSGGVIDNIHGGLEFVKAHTHQPFALPESPVLSGSAGLREWSALDSTALLFGLAYLLLMLAPLALIFSRPAASGTARPVIVSALVVLATYDAGILRHPLITHVRDLAVPLAVVGSWTVVALGRLRMPASWLGRVGRAATLALSALLIVGACGSIWILGRLDEQIGDTRVRDGWPKVRERADAVVHGMTEWPWPGAWPQGDMPPAIEYVAACTAPTDRLLLTWAAPEYYYFARRAFGAGIVMFQPPRAFAGVGDQTRMVSRLERQSVPIALINESRDEEFAETYGTVAAYVRRAFATVGHYEIRDGSHIAIAIRRDRRATGTYGPEGWPCHFVPLDAQAAASHR